MNEDAVIKDLSISLSSLDAENKEYVKYRNHLENAVSSVLAANERLLQSYAERCRLLEKTKQSLRTADTRIKDNTQKIETLKLKNAIFNKFVVENTANQTIVQMKQVSRQYRHEVELISRQIQKMLEQNPDSREIQQLLVQRNQQYKELIEKNKELRKMRDEMLYNLVQFDNTHEKQLQAPLQNLIQKVKENNRLRKEIELTEENLHTKEEREKYIEQQKLVPTEVSGVYSDGKGHLIEERDRIALQFPAEAESYQYYELLDLLTEDDFDDKSLSALAFGGSLDLIGQEDEEEKERERLKKEEEERLRKERELEEQRKREEEERLKREEEERLKREEEERLRREEEEKRKKEEEEERKRKEEEERKRKEEEERKKKEEEERKRKEEEERIRKEKEEEERRRREEEMNKKKHKKRRIKHDFGINLPEAIQPKGHATTEVMTDESGLEKYYAALQKQKELDNQVKERALSDIKQLKSELKELNSAISETNEMIKQKQESRVERISRLSLQTEMESYDEEPIHVVRDTVDVEVLTNDIKTLEQLKAEIAEKNAKASESFLQEQQTIDLREQAAKLELELNVIRLANERKTAELQSYMDRIKAVDAIDFITRPGSLKDGQPSMIEEEKIKRRKERLKGVDKILKQRETDLQKLERKVVDLQTINESINKEIKEKTRQPKMDVKAMCDNLKMCRRHMREYSRQAEFLKIENDALQEEIIRLNTKYNEATEASLRERTEQLSQLLAKQKQRFFSIKGNTNSKVTLTSEDELLWLQVKTREINDAISVIQMRASTVATKIDKQQKQCRDLRIPIPEAPENYEAVLNSRFK